MQLPVYEPVVTVVYDPTIVAPVRQGYSRSPLKPALWLRHVRTTALADTIALDAGFGPVDRADLALAHTERYIDAFMRGTPRALAASADNGWSPGYRDSVLAKVGALVAACHRAVDHPSRIVVCPTSGDHHAQPDRGAGFCPIAGQVIAARRLLASRDVATAWVDLDQHFGNAIPDAIAWDSQIERAVPIAINPRGTGTAYLTDLRQKLEVLEHAVVRGEVGLVCVGHGADSHEWDQLGGAVTTAQWVAAAALTYAAVGRAAAALGRCVPVVTSFFGGYRDDDYTSVLELHTADVATALDTLAGTSIAYAPRVRAPAARTTTDRRADRVG